VTESRHSAADPAPHDARVHKASALLGVVLPPLAWLIQLCAGFAMASQPCFPAARQAAGWHVPVNAMLFLTLAALAINLAALLLAWRDWRATRNEHHGGSEHMIEVGHGRTRFLALWGMILGAGFALIIVANGVALLSMPPCAR
jgi:hypothetical protein